MNTYMTDGVGKKIVEALKKQSEIETNAQQIQAIQQEIEPKVEEVAIQNFDQPIFEEPVLEEAPIESEYNTLENSYVQQPQQPMFGQSVINNVYSQAPTMTSSFTEFNGLEMPPNVAVLKQLISQLPSGVSRQAGALVIKQTMEALGTSMKSVLQEAQQLQETINLSARECQNNILECKKQINTLEAQVHKYQKQAASLNEIISLFVQVN